MKQVSSCYYSSYSSRNHDLRFFSKLMSKINGVAVTQNSVLHSEDSAIGVNQVTDLPMLQCSNTGVSFHLKKKEKKVTQTAPNRKRLHFSDQHTPTT